MHSLSLSASQEVMAGICHGSWGLYKILPLKSYRSTFTRPGEERSSPGSTVHYVIESSILTHHEPNERGKTGVYWSIGALDGRKVLKRKEVVKDSGELSRPFASASGFWNSSSKLNRKRARSCTEEEVALMKMKEKEQEEEEEEEEEEEIELLMWMRRQRAWPPAAPRTKLQFCPRAGWGEIPLRTSVRTAA